MLYYMYFDLIQKYVHKMYLFLVFILQIVGKGGYLLSIDGKPLIGMLITS